MKPENWQREVKKLRRAIIHQVTAHTISVYYVLCIQEYKIDTDEEGKLKQFNISLRVCGGVGGTS